jgi:hypothetical protein
MAVRGEEKAVVGPRNDSRATPLENDRHLVTRHGR